MATTRRNYISAAEVNEMVGITPSDSVLDQAESIIDTYAGFITKWLQTKIEGIVAGVSGATVTLMQKHQNMYHVDYFKGCEIKILGGTGEGQVRRIVSSTYQGVLTLNSAFTTPPDTNSFYSIYQYGKFPRPQDVTYYSEVEPARYYKVIPDAVKQAVAAQVEFIDSMGAEFFNTDKSEMSREQIGDYEYETSAAQGGSGASGIARLIAPKAKALLRGIRCIVGG